MISIVGGADTSTFNFHLSTFNSKIFPQGLWNVKKSAVEKWEWKFLSTAAVEKF